MKKTIIFALAGFAALCSCSALDENPSTSLSQAALYSTESGLESLMVGCYHSFKLQEMMGGKMFEYLQEGSLLVHWKGYRTQSSFQQCLDLTMYSNDQYNQSSFVSTYSGINRCNSVLDNLKDSPVADSYKKEIEAEARLLRAVLYYYAVRMWGDVPLVTSSPKTLEEANMPRTSYLKVYEQILKDLEYAEQNMRTPERQAQINGTAERVHKWAATAWKACVYLQIGCILSDPANQPFSSAPDFSSMGIPDERTAMELALKTAENVIVNGPYELAEKYTDLFKWSSPSDYRLKERIFTITSSEIAGNTSYCSWTLPEYVGGTAHVSAKASNWGRVRPERWVFQKWASEYGGKLGVSRADELEHVYVSCPDPRFDATYIHTSYYNQNTSKNVSIYPKDGCVAGVDASNSTWQRTFAPFFKKYLNPAYNANEGEADLYLLRFAEMYLCAAEAAASLSAAVGDENWNKALSYIEVLHKRARNTRTGASQPVWEDDRFSTKDELINGIFWERIYEMGGEAHEWYDMRRRGARWVIDNITAPMNAFLHEEEQGPSKVEPVEGTGYWQTSYFSRVFPTTVEPVLKGLLCAFPESEILTNSAIGPEDQNPYYFR